MADLRPTSGSFGPSGTFGQPAAPYGNPPAGSPFVDPNTPVITEQAGFMSNTTIVKGYMSTPHLSGIDQHVMEGDIMICIKTKENISKRKFDHNAFLNLGQLNRILSQFYHNGMEELDKITIMSNNNNNNNNKIREIKNVPEDKWTDKRYASDWRKLGLDPRSEYIKGLSKAGIRDKFNILGSLVNDSTGAYNSTISNSRKRIKYKILNVGLKGVAYVRNYWGSDAVPSTILWLILKRRYRRDTETYEEFAFIPHVTERGEIPSLNSRIYYDLNGSLQYGDCFYFGEVLDNENRSPTVETIKKAAGLLGTMDDQVVANRALKTLKVNIRPSTKGTRWL